MKISIGIIAYNEEKNIGRLLTSLLQQKLRSVEIREIIVISSGSTDKTNEIVRKFSAKKKKIKLLTEKKRKGKVVAINKFLRSAKSHILIDISGDVWLKPTTVEAICRPLMNPEVGAVAGRPIPTNPMKSFLGFLVNFEWQMHHEVSLLSPKCGEIVAFRKVFACIPTTVMADEDYIADTIKEKGFKLWYSPKAVVYNKGPERFSDFITQRRRNTAGLLYLQRTKHQKSSTRQPWVLLKAFLRTVPSFRKYWYWIPLTILAELYGRLLGRYDFYIRKRRYTVWKILESER